MRYLILIYSEEPTSPPPAARLAEVGAAYGAYTGMLRDRGAFLGGDELQPTATSTTIRVRDGQTLITDGPFTESREWIAGLAILECADLDEAIEQALRHGMAYEGRLEIRPIHSMGGPEDHRAASRTTG